MTTIRSATGQAASVLRSILMESLQGIQPSVTGGTIPLTHAAISFGATLPVIKDLRPWGRVSRPHLTNKEFILY